MKVIINDKEVPLNEFTTDFIKNTVCGMLRPLKGVDEIKKVEISFEK